MTFLLCFVSLFICKSFTFFVGFNYFVISAIIGNYLELKVSNLGDFYDFFMTLGIFGLSLYLSCSQNCCKNKTKNKNHNPKKRRRGKHGHKK